MANDWRPYIRALIYCIQFQDNATQAVDHVLAAAARGALDLEPTAYRDAIASALSSTEPVARLIPQPHSEEDIRRFLELLLARL